MRDPRYRFTSFFCDDARFEIGGKQTAVGIYAGEMLFPPENEYPLTLARVAVLIHCHLPKDERPANIAFRVEVGRSDDYELLAENILDGEAIDQLYDSERSPEPDVLQDQAEVVIRGTMIFPPMEIQKSCFIRATARIADETYFAGRIRLRIDRPEDLAFGS